MFFTSEASIPFTSKEDVMKAYPNYVLQMMDGNDVFFQYTQLQNQLFTAVRLYWSKFDCIGFDFYIHHQIFYRIWDRNLKLQAEIHCTLGWRSFQS